MSSSSFSSAHNVESTKTIIEAKRARWNYKEIEDFDELDEEYDQKDDDCFLEHASETSTGVSSAISCSHDAEFNKPQFFWSHHSSPEDFGDMIKVTCDPNSIPTNPMLTQLPQLSTKRTTPIYWI
jgi:hypothetical protein